MDKGQLMSLNVYPVWLVCVFARPRKPGQFKYRKVIDFDQSKYLL